MAILSVTGLETHPVGAAGLNAIINANWEQINALMGQSTITSSATPVIGFSGARTRLLALAHNATFSTTGKVAGRSMQVIITADGSLRTLAFPSWIWIGGSAPASIAATKTALLELWCTTTADTGVVARYTVQA